MCIRDSQKAKDVGIGIVNVRNSNHCSCTAYYIRMAAKENMLAIVSSNAPKSMAPWGSREKYLGCLLYTSSRIISRAKMPRALSRRYSTRSSQLSSGTSMA